RCGAGAQQVIVHGGNLKSAFDQLEHDGIDLSFKQNEVAHDHGATVRRLECDPAAQCQRRFDGHAIERHREIRARKAVAMHITRYGGLSTEGIVDFLPVDFLGARARTSSALASSMTSQRPACPWPVSAVSKVFDKVPVGSAANVRLCENAGDDSATKATAIAIIGSKWGN